MRWYYAAGCTVTAVGIALFILGHKMLAFVLVGAGLGGVIGELIMSSVFLPWKVRRIHRQQKDLASPFTYTWDAEFLEARGISGHSKREWKNYAKYKENDKLFLLYHADNLFEMLPKSWFQDQSQVSDFRVHAERVGRT